MKNDYQDYAAGNQLNYLTIRRILPREIVKGYEGHRSWIPRENRSWSSYVLLQLDSGHPGQALSERAQETQEIYGIHRRSCLRNSARFVSIHFLSLHFSLQKCIESIR